MPAAERSDAFSRSRYRFTSGVRAGETVPIRDGNGEVLLSYRSFASIVGIVALVVSVIVALTGIAAVVYLMMDGRLLPATIALMLSAAFAVIIAMLVPPVNVTLYEGTHPVLLITQQSNVSFPVVTFAVSTPDRKVIARLRKWVWSRLARNRWDILSATEQYPIGQAIEESLSSALKRKVAGKFSRRYESNVRIRYLDRNAGWIIRRPDTNGEVDVLELVGEIDHRVAVALATLILGSEP